MNDEILRAAGFGQAVKLVGEGNCPLCSKPVGEFKDALSVKEFKISGMCQKCQDEMFD